MVIGPGKDEAYIFPLNTTLKSLSGIQSVVEANSFFVVCPIYTAIESELDKELPA